MFHRRNFGFEAGKGTMESQPDNAMNAKVSFFSIAILSVGVAARLIAAEPLPPFKEVYELIRTNLSQLKEEEFESRAASALIEKFGGVLMKEGSSNEPSAYVPIYTRRPLQFPQFGYIRVRRIAPELPTELKGALEDSSFTSD